MDLPEPMRNIFILYADREAFKFFDPPDYVWKKRIEIDFNDIAHSDQTEFKTAKEYYLHIDHTLNDRATIITLPEESDINKYNYLYRDQWKRVFTKSNYSLIKDLNIGDIFLFENREYIYFIIHKHCIEMFSSRLRNNLSNFSPIFDFPILYWEKLNLIESSKLVITIPKTIQIKNIDIIYNVDRYPKYKNYLINFKGINYMLLTAGAIRDLMTCYTYRYDPIEFDELIKITDLPIVMKEFKVIKQHILLAPYI